MKLNMKLSRKKLGDREMEGGQEGIRQEKDPESSGESLS